jgi:hypothetical protein
VPGTAILLFERISRGEVGKENEIVRVRDGEHSSLKKETASGVSLWIFEEPRSRKAATAIRTWIVLEQVCFQWWCRLIRNSFGMKSSQGRRKERKKSMEMIEATVQKQ